VQQEVQRKLQGFFMIVSLYAMLMLVMIPCWNCLTLLHSWTYTQLLGTKVPLTFLLVLLGLVGFHFIILLLFFRTARPEVQTFQTIVMIGSAVLTLLGVTFMLFGHEVAELSRRAQKDVEHDCPFARTTQPLYVEAKVLYALRFQPDCAGRTSVEECRGFTSTYSAQVLRSMELDFKCSTFCVDAEPPNTQYPRTLFSAANYQPSCQMMLVRNLRYSVEDMGLQAYFQGCMLVLTSAAIGLLKLLGACVPQRRFHKASPGGYGATRYTSGRGALAS